ncbi:MAG: hypothetical protein HKN57_08810, partial [Xanthomonadales bacterium]|nr:hypothetical protein [Xanthomonadales bacterium]
MNQPHAESKIAASWDQPAASEAQEEGFPLLEYVQLLWYRKKLILAITLFVSVVGWIHVNQIRSIYTASSKMMLGVQQAQAVDIEAVLKRDYWGDQVLAEMEVLRSRGIAGKVAERLKLYQYEE